MNIKNLGKECGFWFQMNHEINPPILIVSNPEAQKQEFVFSEKNKKQFYCFDLKKFIANTTIEINKYKAVFWLKNKQLHRKDGPAVVWPSGEKEWWQNGERHREDGPAVVWADGTEDWYKNGKLHREDGPAIVFADGTKDWWKNGRKISKFIEH